MSKKAWAILYTGPGADPDEPLYICSNDELTGGKSGYAYCCPCRETSQFASKVIAETFMRNNGIKSHHEPIDSETASKQKASRKPKKKQQLKIGAAPMKRPVSALTGVILK